MNFKKMSILILIILGVLITGCRTIKKMIPIRGVGSTIYIGGYENKPYKIEDLNVSSRDGYFLLEDYVVSNEGKPFNILDSKGKYIGCINLIKKNTIYSENHLNINLSNYNYDVIKVEPNVNIVYIVGQPNMSTREIFICIDPRETPLDIYLENVNITTNYTMPVIYNCSGADMNIICKGTNYITAGSTVPPLKLLDYFNTVKDVYTVATAPFEVYSIAEGWVDEAIKSGIISGLSGDGIISGFYDSMYGSMEESLELTKQWYNSLMNVTMGSNGVKGMDGTPAIKSLGGVSFYGDGNLVITGGNGTNGTDAKSGILGSILYDRPGGTGGKGGAAVMAYAVINMSNGNCRLVGGEGGSGGKNYNTSGQTNYASKGQKGGSTFSDFYYSNNGE